MTSPPQAPNTVLTVSLLEFGHARSRCSPISPKEPQLTLPPALRWPGAPETLLGIKIELAEVYSNLCGGCLVPHSSLLKQPASCHG